MNDSFPSVRLLDDELSSGPWVFARSVATPARGESEPEDGALVEVFDYSQRFVGHALYNGASDIRLRFLARGKRSQLARPRDFLLQKLAAADRLRRKVLRLTDHSSAYRVAHAEADDLSGLIVDRLGPSLVVEYHALGFWRLRAEVEWALGQLYPEASLHARVPDNAARQEYFPPLPPEPEAEEVLLMEHGLFYPIRPAGGHKTGWFCDQRENRLRIGALARERDVLDLFCNAGGFACQAAKQGARRVRAVDLDEIALERAARAAQHNRLAVETIHADAFDVLRDLRSRGERPDLIIVDPHKLIRNPGQREEGLRTYHDLNSLALEVVRPGGLVASYSCSGLLDLPGFLGMLFASARRAAREIRLLETHGPGPDHPQRPDFSRSRYLKGALLAAD